MRKSKTFKIKGEKFEFQLEVNHDGFTLWTKKIKGTNSVWILDASVICDDGFFMVGRQNDVYGFDIDKDDYDFGPITFTLTKSGDAHETAQMGLEVSSGQE